MSSIYKKKKKMFVKIGFSFLFFFKFYLYIFVLFTMLLRFCVPKKEISEGLVNQCVGGFAFSIDCSHLAMPIL